MKQPTFSLNVLLLGSGGREHALAWKIIQSILCKKLFTAPGNTGTGKCGTNVDVKVTDFPAMKQFCIDNEINMVIVGPEDPLVLGIYDFFTTDPDLSHVMVIGPSKLGALLEGDKLGAKKFMLRHQIPTAQYKAYASDETSGLRTYEDALRFVDSDAEFKYRVTKATRLAAGKGVLIGNTKDEVKEHLKQMLVDRTFGEAGDVVVLEEFLTGTEFSVFVLTDGKNYKLFPVAKDYKRIGAGDTGLNTGGMGAVSFDGIISDEMLAKVEERIIKPTINGLAEEGIAYKGIIYFGLMDVDGEPHVIEYNCRFGDPETQVVLPRITSDLLEHFIAVAKGTLKDEVIEIDSRACATIVAASAGYPGDYEKGKEITLPGDIGESIIFHAGTIIDNGLLRTSGGRVLAVTSFGETIDQALENSNTIIGQVEFDGSYHRSDIGYEFKKVAVS